jgi:hypothetical protein
MTQSIQDLIDLYATKFKADDFMKGITRSFQKTGSVPTFDLDGGKELCCTKQSIVTE